MAFEALLYSIAVLIFYDFSLHFIELAFGRGKALALKPYWPQFKSRQNYSRFWAAYWLFTFVLVLLYLYLNKLF